MLGSIRKFSSSIFAKIFLGIVAVPFIFWGMGDLFRSGNQNTIVKIDNKKITTKEFIDYLNFYKPEGQDLNNSLVENMLMKFVGEKLIKEEISNFNFNLSDKSLSKIIKNEEIFKKKGTFSRIEYEKFLVKNSINAVAFEKNLLNQEKKRQLLNFIGGGIVPSNFIVNLTYDKINQKRKIQLINLNDALKNEISFTDSEIENYFKKNKNLFTEIFKTIKFKKINPKNLVETDEYNDLFFKKIDEIDDLIVQGKKLDFIINKYNLENPKTIYANKKGYNKKYEEIKNFPVKIIKNLFDTQESLSLIEYDNNYFIIEVVNDETILKDLNNTNVKKEIVFNLENNDRRKLISSIIGKINNNNFTKSDFDQFSKEKNVEIKKIFLNNINDDKNINVDLVSEIYTFQKNKVIFISDIDMKENFLIYIDSIENVTIDNKSDEYEKYYKLAKLKMTNNIYNSYNNYLEQKYNIDINYNSLNNVKNYTK